MGRPLFDSSDVTSSWMTSQCRAAGELGCCGRGASPDCDRWVAVHARADAGAVVDQVELAPKRRGVGRSGLLGEPGEECTDLVAVVVRRLLD
jgi:hypothetical protein